MAKRKVNYDNVKLRVTNPEAIPAASKKLTEMLYQIYIDKVLPEQQAQQAK